MGRLGPSLCASPFFQGEGGASHMGAEEILGGRRTANLSVWRPCKLLSWALNHSKNDTSEALIDSCDVWEPYNQNKKNKKEAGACFVPKTGLQSCTVG